MTILRQERVFHVSFKCADLTACGRFINTAKRGDGPFLRKQERVFYCLHAANLSNNLRAGYKCVKALVGLSALLDLLAQYQ